MNKSGLPTIAWVLVGLLVIAGGLISLGEQDIEAQPEASSFSPSGISAFVELLRKSGVQVRVDSELKPKLGAEDVAVAFNMVSDRNAGLFGETQATSAESQSKRFQDSFWQKIKSGGSGIFLPIKSDYLEASRSTEKSPFVEVTDDATGHRYRITDSGISEDQAFDYDVDPEPVEMDLWRDPKGSFLRAYRYGKGTVLVARDGIGVTNRFIDKYDNAKAFGQILGMLANSGKRVVFTEASFGNVRDMGLLETVGPWANAAWQQLLFLGVVVVITLGMRFGLPEEQKTAQRGSRELLDAIADTYRRAQSTQAALAAAYHEADTDLRLVLKLPRDAPRTDRDRLLPVSLQNSLARLQVSSEYPSVTQDHALGLIVEAQKELEAFLGPNRAKMRSLAKLKT